MSDHLYNIRPIESDENMPYDLLLDADPSRRLVDRYLPLSEVYVVMSGQEIVGVYLLFKIDEDVAEIKNIAVREELQGHGIGKLMLKDAIMRASARGFKTIIIGTANSSVGQLHLYQKMGFEMTGIKLNYFIDNYESAFFENGIQVKHMIVLARQL